MIPDEKCAAVTRGLHQAFGETEIEEIRELTGRGSNPVFRTVVRGSVFLLRINVRAGDMGRHYSCMKAAAEAGVAPRVWYTHADDRISITDFVEVAPFSVTDALIQIPAALRALHALPPFPNVPNHLNTSCMFLVHKGPAVDGFLLRIREANFLPKSEREEFFARYAEVAALYPHCDADMVSSHNDLFKPDNMLFDGKRVWLADWEAAFLNDRYADLAVVANLIVTNDAEERVFLQEYFGQAPDAYQRARFFLAVQLAHMFYATVFLLLGSVDKQIDWTTTPPQFTDLQRRIWAGDIKLDDKETKIAFGMAHWQQLFHQMRQARFDEALRIVSDRKFCRLT